jgi:hypothetical protein
MNFLTNIDWSSPATIGIGVGIIVAAVVVSYLYWAWTEKKFPFNQ